MECVNGDYGDYTNVLAEAAAKPEWKHDYQAIDMVSSTLKEVQIVKMSEASELYNGKRRFSLAHNHNNNNKHLYPPPEWMRLWLLIGRCHVQIFRDWVS